MRGGSGASSGSSKVNHGDISIPGPVEGPFTEVTIIWAAANPMLMPENKTVIATQIMFRSSVSLRLKTATLILFIDLLRECPDPHVTNPSVN
jgi:hypothetical protein